MDMSHSLTVGAIMGLSSTAVALKSFQEFGLDVYKRQVMLITASRLMLRVVVPLYS